MCSNKDTHKTGLKREPFLFCAPLRLAQFHGPILRQIANESARMNQFLSTYGVLEEGGVLHQVTIEGKRCRLRI